MKFPNPNPPDIRQENSRRMWSDITLPSDTLIWGNATSPPPFISLSTMSNKEFKDFEDRWNKTVNNTKFTTTSSIPFVPTFIDPKLIERVKEEFKR